MSNQYPMDYVGGEWRYLARVKPAGENLASHCGLKSLAESPIPLIPESEWVGLVKKKEAEQSWVKDTIDFGPLDQNGTNYCWVNAVTGAAMCTRRRMGLPHVDLSPASVGGPIKGYRNVGGWGGEAFKYASENGFVPCDKWGANAIRSSLDTEETRALRPHFQIREGFMCETWAQVVSAILQDYDLFVGYAWWSHEVQISRLYFDGSESADNICPEIWNSWGPGYGTKNKYGIGGFAGQGQKGKRFDDAGIIYQMSAFDS